MDHSQPGQPLFNGNIGNATYAIGTINNNDAVSGFTGYVYRYDQLNRLTGMNSYRSGSIGYPGTWSNASLSGPVSQRLSYDGNGNILTNTSTALSNLQYNYNRDANGYLLNNKLRHVSNLDNQGVDNYGYDAIGNLVSDASQSLSRINWTVYGKMASISKGSVSGLQFGYDAGGNRITKASQTVSGTTTTHYVRDAQGNVLAVYQYKANGSGVLTEGGWTEQHLYGSSRLGMVTPHVAILPGQKLGSDAYNAATDGVENAGNRQYELTNHLGNVMATIDDILLPGDRYEMNGKLTLADNFAVQLTAQDYYPFGLPSQSSYLGGVEKYRYGFNGKENDNEVEGAGNVVDYGMRVYDPRIGRFFSVDPIAKKYPELTPYQYASNSSISGVDLDGLEYVGTMNELPSRTVSEGVSNSLYNVIAKGWNSIAGLWNGGVDFATDASKNGLSSAVVSTPQTFYESNIKPMVDHVTTTPIKQQGQEFVNAAKDPETYFQAAENFLVLAGTWKLTTFKMENSTSALSKTIVKTAAANSGRLTVPLGLTNEQFKQMSQMIRDKVGDMSQNIVVQGSRVSGTALPGADIDIAIKVGSKEFSEFLGKRFLKINVRTANEKTFIRAFQSGKIQAGEAGLSSLRKKLEELLGIPVDISVLKEGGAFDNGPQMPLAGSKTP